MSNSDLGFSYQIRKQGEVQVFHHGKLAATLRGQQAQAFLADLENSDEEDTQQLMARLTGNYKRGNERTAKNHPRNRS